MTVKPKLDYKLLIYDIEVPHLKTRLWRLGENVVRHDQLLPYANQNRILTIAYKWYDEKEIYVLDCGEDGLKEKEMVSKFDEEIRKADVIIGKNSHRFDNKFINTMRLLHDNKPMPQWYYKSDDVESQIRKYFQFPSYSLDYLSSIFGQGGKLRMERKEWINIEDMIELGRLFPYIKKCSDNQLDGVCQFLFNKTYQQVYTAGRRSFALMKKYNKKDVRDTESLLIKILPHVKWKYNASARQSSTRGGRTSYINLCITCGSNDIRKDKNVIRSTGHYMEFYCNNHKGYAGARAYKRNLNRDIKFTGRMGK